MNIITTTSATATTPGNGTQLASSSKETKNANSCLLQLKPYWTAAQFHDFCIREFGLHVTFTAKIVQETMKDLFRVS